MPEKVASFGEEIAMSSSKHETSITVTLPNAIVAKVREVGRDKGCSDSGVLRDALAIYLDNWAWYDSLLGNEEKARSLDVGPDDVARLIAEYREEVKAEHLQQD